MAEFTFTIRTPAGSVYEAQVDTLVVPGTDGSFGVLAGHAPMIAGVAPGIVEARLAGETRVFAVSGGVADVSPPRTVLLVDEAVSAADIWDAQEKLARLRHEREGGTGMTNAQ